MEQAPVLLLAKTGYILRDLLLGPFAQAVVRERPLVAAVPNPDDPVLRKLVAGRAELIPFPGRVLAGTTAQHRCPQMYMYRFKQAEKPSRSLRLQTRLFEPVQTSWRWALFTKALQNLGRVFVGTGTMGGVEDLFLSHIAGTEEGIYWKRVLAEMRPAAIVSTMLTLTTLLDVSVDLPVLAAARSLGIRCGMLVQSWDNLSTKTSVLPPWLDRFWSWSDWMTHQLLDFNPRVPASKVVVVGSPHFDFHRRKDLIVPRKEYLSRFGLDAARPMVLFGPGTRVGMPLEPLTVTQLAEGLRQSVPETQMLIRLHPKDRLDRWQELLPRLEAAGARIYETGPSLHMDWGGFMAPEDFFRNQISDLTHAAVIVNSSSTLTVDAAILDRPIVIIGYDPGPDHKFPEGRALIYSQSDHFAPLAASGGLWLARSQPECLEAIRAYLRDPALHREGREAIASIVAGPDIGRASEALAREVLALAGQAGSLETLQAVSEPAVSGAACPGHGA